MIGTCDETTIVVDAPCTDDCFVVVVAAAVACCVLLDCDCCVGAFCSFGFFAAFVALL